MFKIHNYPFIENSVAYRKAFRHDLGITDLGVTLSFPCSFKTQFWGVGFGSNFGEQLSGAALENSSGE